MKVNREQFLQALQSVSAGLSQRDIIEQSSCFVLDQGEVLTFNDEVSCRHKSGLPKEVKGAVKAEYLLEQLQKRPDETMELEVTDTALIFKGKNKGSWKSTHNMEAEVFLPIDSVERPEEWVKLDETFADAIGMVSHCAGTDESKYDLTCVHISPKWVEACDNFQMCRWRLRTGVSTSILVKAVSIKQIVSLGMIELGETEHWLHFRSASGLVYSCRRYMEDYKDIGHVLKVEGVPMSLPKTLIEASDRANVFSKENADNNQVKLILKPGKVTIKGQGPHGAYQQSNKINYDGERIEFFINPGILGDLANRHKECIIGKDRLLVNGGSYRYVSVLSLPEDEPRNREVEEIEA